MHDLLFLSALTGSSLLYDLQRCSLRPNVLKPLLQRMSVAAEVSRAQDDDSIPLLGVMPPKEILHNTESTLVSTRITDPTAASSRQSSPAERPRPSSGPTCTRGALSTATGIWASSNADDGNDEDAVAPVPIRSERELSLEFATIVEQLNHKTDWAVRNAACRRLQAIALGGACDFAGFLNCMKALRDPLSAQCAELRSSIVREACAALVVISSALREAFEPFVHDYFPPLLKQTVVTIQVIRESTNECIRALIIYTCPIKATPKFLSALSDRSATLRKNASIYLLLLLDTAPVHPESERSPLDRYAEQLLSVLRSALTDAVSEVRATSRSTFWAFHRHFPSRADRLLPLLDAATHRLVLEEQAHYEHERESGVSMQVRGKVHGGSRGAVLSGSTKAPPTAVVASERSNSLPLNRGICDSASCGVGGLAVAKNSPQQRQEQNADPVLENASLTRTVSFERRAAARRDDAAASVTSSRTSPREPSNWSKERPKPRGERSDRSRAAEASVCGYGVGPLCRSNGMPRCESSRGPPEGQAVAATQGEQKQQLLQADVNPTSQLITRSDGFSDCVSKVARVQEMEAAATVLIKGNSSLWSVRANACELLSRMMLDAHGQQEVAPLADKVASLVLERLSDPHYKVVHAALLCTGTLAGVFPGSMEPALERFLPLLLLRTQETRDSLRAVALASLEAVKVTFTPEALLPVLLRVLDVPTPRVRAAALSLLASCASDAPHFMLSPANMRAFVAKAHMYVSDKSPELRRAALSALHSLHAAGESVFVAQVRLLPIAAQNTIKTHLLQRNAANEAEDNHSKKSTLQTRTLTLTSDDSMRRRQQRQQADSEQLTLTSSSPRRPSPSPKSETSGDGGQTSYANDHDSGGGGREGSLYASGDAVPPSNACLCMGRTACAPLEPKDSTYTDCNAQPTDDLAARPLQPNHQAGNVLVPPPANAANACNTSSPHGSMSVVQGFATVSEDWATLMPSLLRQMAVNATTPSQRAALAKLQKMALCVMPEAPVWSQHFEHALEAVLRAMQHADNKLREQAISCLRDLLRSQPHRFKSFTEHVLLRLLAAGRDACRDVTLAAEEALELLLSRSDGHRCMAVLVPVVMKEGPPTLQLAVRLQSKLVPRFTQLQLLAILPQVLPPLFEAFKDPNADVRKAVVFCLVDMYMVLGEQLTPHLAVLSTSQLKLVTIYINRTAKARAERSSAAEAEEKLSVEKHK